jgi:hypothetical protein
MTKFHWYCEPREDSAITLAPFDGFIAFEFEHGEQYGAVIYDNEAWWYDDGKRVERCVSYRRAVRRWARACWGRAR